MKETQILNSSQVTEALAQFLKSKLNITVASPHEIYSLMNQMKSSVKNSIWAHVAKKLKVESQKLHDFYYNSWITQFFADSNTYKHELKQLINKNLESCNSLPDLINMSINQLQLKNLQSTLCKRKLYQMVYSYAKEKLQKYNDEKQYNYFDDFNFD
uniref:Uncharacterized protein n=1 Tax=Trepomonas sp. PC1 TaxID=1076344 RepID=A0A146KAB7_9EUKA|eukprot:JAP93507.1 Hypothetical protein TPC1_14193 [Trepomonas sp. PC1]